MVDHQDLARWRGTELLDSEGDKVGKLEDVYVDVDTDEPRFGTVKEGTFGKHLTFVPLVGATIGPESLQLAVSRKQVKDAPNLEAAGDLSVDDEEGLYRHYGISYSAPPKGGRRLGRR